jgi:transcriptional regulator with XRE-family HTH domain
VTTWDIVCADVNEWTESYDGPPFHAVLCDAPYEMRKIDINDLQAQGKGFMGAEWDGSGVSLNPDTWRNIARHLLPGAFLFVFAGTINDDLISVAMRRAGLRKHHKGAFYHAQGQGFPKSTKICTQVDKHGGESVGWFGPWLREWREKNDVTQKEIAELFPSKTGGLTGCVANWELGMNTPTADQFNTICEHFKLPFKSLEEAEREVMSTVQKPPGWYTQDDEYDITAPATPLAQTWAGHRYGGQVLKPSVESVLIFQKYYEGRPVDSITGTGAGALNIEQARISVGNDYRDAGWGPRYGASSMPNMGGHQTRPWVENAIDDNRPVKDSKPGSGRWPSNLLLAHIPPHTCPACDGDGCDACGGEGAVGGCVRVGEKKVKGEGGRNIVAKSKGASWYGPDEGQRQKYHDPDGNEVVADWRCVDGCPVKALGEQSGERRSGGQMLKHNKDQHSQMIYGTYGPQNKSNYHLGDKGTAARYFHQSDWTAERIEQADPVFYCAKSSRRERDSGLDGFEPKTNAEREKRQMGNNSKGSVGGSGKPINGTGYRSKPRNFHPTCKPISLAKHLASLLLPPPEYAPRRLLIPFAGSGSEAIGAMLAGWEEIVCIELIQDYCDIAEARLAWWADWLAYTGVDDPKELLRLSNNGRVRREKEAERLV